VPPTILVVEDNPITRKMVRVALAAEGYSILEAPDGRTALDLAAAHAPDLILQDLLLPDMDGFELVGRLRALPGAGEIPIIAFSGFLSRLDTARALAGFSDFLVKPVEPSQLVQTIRIYLPSPALEADKPGHGRRILIAEDDPMQLRLARLHLERLGFQVATASDGAAALEAARRAPPDAILSDVLMPRLDGFQLCLAIRRDPALARVPVVLCSSHYLEEADRRLSERVGASALALRTPDYGGVIKALLAHLGRTPPLIVEPVEALEAERVHRAVQQLERQVAANLVLTQRASLQASVLSILAGLSDTLTKPVDAHGNLSELLVNVLDAGGASTGALYLTAPGGELRLAAQSGRLERTGEGAATFFGHPELFAETVATGRPVSIPSAVAEPTAREFLARMGVKSAEIVPLTARGERIGALLLGANRADLTRQDWLGFALTMAGQIAQAIALNRAFTTLATTEAKYRALFENAVEGIYQSSPDGHIVLANPALARMLAYASPAELVATVTDVAAQLYVDPERRAELMRGLEERGAVSGFEARVRRKDGSVIWVSLSERVVRDCDGTLRHYEGIVEDVTARKQAEEELRRQREALIQTEKLAAMGSLLAGVAHELNNPLSVVLGQAAMLSTKIGAGPLAERVLKIGNAAERCARIVGAFLALARQRPAERQEVRLNAVVRDTVEMLAYPLRVDNVSVGLNLADDLPPLWADPHQLTQVVVNLVSNAHQAMRETAGPRRILLTTRLESADGGAVLEVADTGPGIPPAIQARIFEPFFTTKPTGQGTGLGLSLCQGIVESHGGTIRLQSAPGHGAVFRVELPVAAPRPAGPTPRAAEVPPLAAKTILVVDDEAEVAEVLADMLEGQGHRVETASDGAAALDKLEAQRYDLVLSDVKMPRLDGQGLYREVERRHPELRRRFVFLTGDTLSGDIVGFLDRSGLPSLSKPFTPDQVRRVVEQALRTL
jgi:PAS domain S-box-containing protein